MPDERHNQKAYGVHVAKGTALQIPVGGLKISFTPKGDLKMTARVEVLQVMTPHWLGIAVDHLDVAKKHHETLIGAIAAKSDAAIGTNLERDFLESMQASVAAAIAFDALYASVKEYVSLPDDMLMTWQKNRTARYKQVLEVLRRGFCLRNHEVQNLCSALKLAFEARDLAVHPKGNFSTPILHPDLGHYTEWRFVQFRYETAHTIVRAALAFTRELTSKGLQSASNGLVTLSQGIYANLDCLLLRWEERHGKLTQDFENSNSS
jgi:hypothetical protein